MTLSELLIKVPELENYLRYMPEELKTRCTIKTYPPKTIILRLVSQKVAYKLYRSSYNRGNRLFYPPQHLLLLYFLQYIEEYHSCVIRRTREEIHEETGISVKTLNRTIRKLKESGMVGITKGKVTMDEAQQKMAREYVQDGRE
mgnify:CR=1 FL=1